MVWRDEHGWLPDMLESEREVDPDSLTIVVAEVGDTVACAAWIRYAQGTEFAALFGGATLATGGGAGSTAPPSPTERTWSDNAASAISRQTLPTTAARFSYGSGSPR
jgi:hypothetical protein